MARNKDDGDCLNGSYLWAAGMIIVDKLTEETIKRVVWDMAESGDIENFMLKIEN